MKTAIVGVTDSQSLEIIALIDGNRGLSTTFFPTIAPLICDISFIAVGTGPGSYMGIRTGATVAKALAYSKDIPLIGFSSILVAIPESILGPFVFVGDAKMEEYFLIEGMASEKRIECLSNPRLVAKSKIEEELPEDRQVVGKEPIEPHLNWALPQVAESLSQNQTAHPEGLRLNYIR